jgi:pSer/pThr/pTyr-binding forkhead associated (FHA) protein
MVAPGDKHQGSMASPSLSLTNPTNVSVGSLAMPVLTLYNSSMNIRIQGINGAIIGRRQGPYVNYFEQNKYVSGVHAQLKYNAGSGWCVIDKHSSNGTQLNQRLIQPDVEMSLKNGDILSIANVNFQVNVN